MSAPRISVIVATDRYSTIRRVLRSLRSQTARSRMEVVIVMPAGARQDDDDVSLEGEFAALRLVEIPTIHPMPAARAAGIRAATAPIVFLGETHSFPEPGFFEAILDAHTDDVEVVVPGLSNANPESSFSWGSFLADYGIWLDSLPAGATGGGPTWNVAYRKSVLEEVDERLELAMEHGDEMGRLLHARGTRFRFEPRARLLHANVSMAKWWIEQRYLCGQLVGNARKNRWGLGRRLVYVAASPIIPFLTIYRLRRTLASLRARGELDAPMFLTFCAGCIVRTAGEVVGYIRGAAIGAQERMDHYELHKLEYTSMSRA
jgi:hypothetical protein